MLWDLPKTVENKLQILKRNKRLIPSFAKMFQDAKKKKKTYVYYKRNTEDSRIPF